MDEQRKNATLFAATTLAARKLNETGAKPCPAREYTIVAVFTVILTVAVAIRPIWGDRIRGRPFVDIGRAAAAGESAMAWGFIFPQVGPAFWSWQGKELLKCDLVAEAPRKRRST